MKHFGWHQDSGCGFLYETCAGGKRVFTRLTSLGESCSTQDNMFIESTWSKSTFWRNHRLFPYHYGNISITAQVNFLLSTVDFALIRRKSLSCFRAKVNVVEGYEKVRQFFRRIFPRRFVFFWLLWVQQNNLWVAELLRSRFPIPAQDNYVRCLIHSPHQLALETLKYSSFSFE